MATFVGLRREDKSKWERRVPIVPQDAAELQGQGIHVIAQTSDIRAFTDDEFAAVGIAVEEDLSACPVILGIKEMPEAFFERDKTYVFFAHVIKGQPANMPMLRRLLDLGCTLIDYERVVDEMGRRLIFFGWHAGVAGMIDTLWALGNRLTWRGIASPFADLRQTHTYHDLAEAKAALKQLRTRISTEGLPEEITPLLIGIAGYGNVSQGAQSMLDLLPIIEIEPQEVAATATSTDFSRKHIYKAVFKEQHMVEPALPGSVFELQDYYNQPEKYKGVFAQYVPHLTVLVNAIYWTERYPRLVTKADLKQLFNSTLLPHDNEPRLQVIGDISCDVDGAIECNVKATDPGNPIYVYDPTSDTVRDGHKGPGVVVMAVEILPSELPRKASADFSRVLKPFVPAIAQCDYSLPFEDCTLPPEIKRAVIAYQGRLTPDYQYIRTFLK